MSQSTSFTTPGSDYGVELGQIERKRALAQALQQQAMQPIEQQTAGGWVVRNSPLQGAAKLAQALASNRQQKRADTEQRDLTNKVQGDYRSMLAQGLAQLQGTPDRTIQPDPQEAQQAADYGTPQVGQVTQPGVAPNPAAAMATFAAHPMGGPLAQMAAAQMPKKPEPYTLKPGETRYDQNGSPVATGAAEKPDAAFALAPGHTRYDASGKPIVTAPSRPDEQVPVTITTVMHKGVPMQVNARTYKGEGSDVGVIGPANKPANTQLPQAALKEQQEKLDAMGIAGNINADLGAVLTQLNPSVDANGAEKPPALQLGLANNAVGTARNYVGMSNENSRNLGTFKSTLEKLRNDSLRLNKGVQTEGDAQRAWNELFANINDQEFVKKRLGEIVGINERAVRQHQMAVDAIRRNYGLEPMDASAFSSQPPAITGGAPQPDRRGNDPLGIRKK